MEAGAEGNAVEHFEMHVMMIGLRYDVKLLRCVTSHSAMRQPPSVLAGHFN